jgi:hypothetical protein
LEHADLKTSFATHQDIGGDFIHLSFWCVKFYLLQKILLPFDEVPLFKWNFAVTPFWLPGHAGDSSIEAANADALDTTL